MTPSSAWRFIVTWSWALLSDPRPELDTARRRLMAEAYVRGMQGLVAGGE